MTFKRLAVAIIATFLCVKVACAGTKSQGGTLETVAVAVIVAVAAVGLVWMLRRKKEESECGDCPLSESCQKPKNKRKNRKS